MELAFTGKKKFFQRFGFPLRHPAPLRSPADHNSNQLFPAAAETEKYKAGEEGEGVILFQQTPGAGSGGAGKRPRAAGPARQPACPAGRPAALRQRHSWETRGAHAGPLGGAAGWGEMLGGQRWVPPAPHWSLRAGTPARRRRRQGARALVCVSVCVCVCVCARARVHTPAAQPEPGWTGKPRAAPRLSAPKGLGRAGSPSKHPLPGYTPPPRGPGVRGARTLAFYKQAPPRCPRVEPPPPAQRERWIGCDYLLAAPPGAEGEAGQSRAPPSTSAARVAKPSPVQRRAHK